MISAISNWLLRKLGGAFGYAAQVILSRFLKQIWDGMVASYRRSKEEEAHKKVIEAAERLKKAKAEEEKKKALEDLARNSF